MSLLSNLKEFRNIKPCWASFSSNSLFGTKSKYKDNWPPATTARPLSAQAAFELDLWNLRSLSVAKFFDRILRQNTHQERTARQGPSLAAPFNSVSYYPENQQSTTISWTPLAPFLLVNVVIMLDSLTVSSPLAETNSKRNKALIVRNCHRSEWIQRERKREHRDTVWCLVRTCSQLSLYLFNLCPGLVL